MSNLNKVFALFIFVFAGAQICYADILYDANSQILYVGGEPFFDAQSYDGRDVSLNNKIVKIDLVEDKIEDLYKFTDTNLILNVNLSPNGKYIAAVVRDALVVISNEGTKITTLKNTVNVYEWSPDSKYIAYITGTMQPEGREPFKSSGLWIYDIENDKSEKISENTIKIRFSRQDGKLHYGNRIDDLPTQFFSYDTESRLSNSTTIIGLDFSPDGKYFLRDASGEYDFVLCLTEGNKKLHWLPEVKNINEVYWLTNDTVFNFSLNGSFTFNPFTKEKINTFEGTVMGWSPDRKYVVSYKDKYAVITETLTGKVTKRIKVRK